MKKQEQAKENYETKEITRIRKEVNEIETEIPKISKVKNAFLKKECIFENMIIFGKILNRLSKVWIQSKYASKE